MGCALKVERFHEMDHVEACLVDWARFLRGYNPVDGYPGRSDVLGTGGASKSFDAMCEASDMKIARITDTVIGDLPANQQCALHHAYLNAVWRFMRNDYEAVLAAAKNRVRDGLRARGVWLGE